MVDLKEAVSIAERLISAPYIIVGASKTDRDWILDVGTSFDEEGDENTPLIFVSIETGKADEIYLPSDEGFTRMDGLIEIDLP